jgi:hypothetical protein
VKAFDECMNMQYCYVVVSGSLRIAAAFHNQLWSLDHVTNPPVRKGIRMQQPNQTQSVQLHNVIVVQFVVGLVRIRRNVRIQSVLLLRRLGGGQVCRHGIASTIADSIVVADVLGVNAGALGSNIDLFVPTRTILVQRSRPVETSRSGVATLALAAQVQVHGRGCTQENGQNRQCENGLFKATSATMGTVLLIRVRLGQIWQGCGLVKLTVRTQPACFAMTTRVSVVIQRCSNSNWLSNNKQ